jgi:uncharacterized membrane protein
MTSAAHSSSWLRPAVLAVHALLILLVVTAVVRATGRGGAVAMLLLLLLPLVLPLAALVRRTRRGPAWATLGVTPCIVYGLTETIANPSARPLAAAVLFASLTLFALLVAQLNAERGRSQPSSTDA